MTSTRRQKRAVTPLLPHLSGVRTFAEPCSGDGSLAAHLEDAGLRCGAFGDLNDANRLDARTWDRDDFDGIDAVITNPPWEARTMMGIMEHQSTFRPSWFLIYSDWLFTHQSSGLMKDRCTDIVPVGRVKWIEGSKSVGFDNCCWVRMWKDKDSHSPAMFWPMRP
jgi:hypothetical protein